MKTDYENPIYTPPNIITRKHDSVDTDELEAIEAVRSGVFTKSIHIHTFDLYRTATGITCNKDNLNDTSSLHVRNHLFILNRIWLLACHVFSDEAAAKNWMNTVTPILGAVTPVSLLDTTFGARLVEDILVRIEHGMVA